MLPTNHSAGTGQFELTVSTASGILVLKPTIHSDQRGYFCETYRRSEFEKFGIPFNFLQENFSHSTFNTFRGLHLQYNKPQGKLITVVYGKVLFYELDARPASPHFGEIFMQEMSDVEHCMMWLPPGIANGFLVKSDVCGVSYKCTEYWDRNSEISIRCDSLDTDTYRPSPIISAKDRAGISLQEWNDKYHSIFGSKNIF